MLNYYSKFILVGFLVMLGSIHNLLAQESSISGQITDQDSGEPLIGVTVLIKGTSSGTVTDFNGNYTLSASPEDILVFTYVGYASQEIKVSESSSFDISLGVSSKELEEIVVVGYTTEKKEDLTGAIQVVELEKVGPVAQTSGNPMQALQGRVAGLYIEKNGSPSGANSRILVRGQNTLGNNDPLYIIDGLPTKRPDILQTLTPDAIESIQVLKDAASASIYGSRASNGVVIVKTKDGSSQTDGLKVLYNTHFSMQSEKNLRVKMLNAEERGRALWQASVNDGVDPASGYGEIYNFDWNGDFNNPVLNGVTVQPYVGGDTNVPVGDTDWQDESYETGFVYNNNLTVYGGSDVSSVLVSVGHMKNTGILKYTDYERTSARVNAITSHFDKKLRIGVNTQFVNSNETLETPDLGSAPTPQLAVTLAPTIPVYTLNGEYAGPLGAGYSDRNNPVHMQYINRWDNTNRQFLYGNIFAELDIIENLKFRTSLGYDISRVSDKDIEQSFSEGFIARDVNRLIQTNNQFTSLVWTNFLNYNVDLGSSTLGILLGVESIDDQAIFQQGVKDNFSIQTEEFFTLSAGTSNGNAFGNQEDSRLLSQFAKVNYAFRDKYLAAVTVRRDGSSRFGEENRYGFFPSASVAWKLGKEAFMQDIPFLSSLKVRAGYGEVGNQDIGAYPSLGLLAPRYGQSAAQVDGIGHVGFFDQYWNIGTAYDLSGNNTGNLPSGFAFIQSANPDLRWEATSEINLGVDFSLFQAAVIGSFDYFSKTTDGILIQPPVASVLGEGQLRFVNGATIENKGWEFNLNYLKEVSQDFNWSINLNASHFKDKITKLPEEVRAAFPGNSEQDILGHSNLSIFGYRADGIFQSQEEVDAHATQVGAGPGRIRYMDLNGDNTINSLDQTFIGTQLPDLEYGIRLDINYKNFDFSLFGSGIAGREGFDNYKFLNEFIRGRENVGPGVFDAWTPDNPTATIPALTLSDGNNETRTSDYLMVNTSYFKMRNIQVGYTLPSALVNRLFIDRLRVYAVVDNPFVIKSKDFSGPDPERTTFDIIPVPRSLSFGVNLAL
ncbi:TonB-dependent receptor [Marinoscillum sp. MHG1-6]|uniref:SusC/RagA family TonB-linked outer membrane protein n=1 Tax=Marinoscillum sp. MHG1-6 TaxID=2959627 RepID=UPI0021571621|nr:TonB-dependent receptor [Marinoscillum sp. MHG1-6]